MYIYADMVFIINVIMNSVILMLTAWTSGMKYNLWRILLAATVGSSYVLAGMLPCMAIFNTALFKILMSLILILLAFGFQSVRTMLLLVGTFYIIAFILGGAVAGWLYFWQTSSYLGSYDSVLKNLSWTNLFTGSCIGIFLIVLVIRRMLASKTRSRNLYQVKLEYDGRIVDLTAMLDTGNGLYTVLGHKPVILVNQHSLEPILSEEVVSFLGKHTPEMWMPNLDKCGDLSWISRTQIIPYHAIGNRSMLLAFRPDNVMVSSKQGFIDVSDVVIAIYSGTLSGDGTYSVLLHPQIINELSKKQGASICA